MKGDPIKAWQPLTFGGVARYAHDWIGRLLVTWLIVAMIAAGAVVWTANRAWAPVIYEAITKLPPTSEIRAGRLQASQSARLAENPSLSIALDPHGNASASLASSSDLQVTLTPSAIQFRALFGTTAIAYQPQWTLQLNSSDLDPWWGAWRPAILTYLGIGTIAFLLVSWLSLATLYTLVPLISAAIARRDISLWGSWKLSAAALMSGAIFLAIAIILYGLGELRVPEMIGAFALHFVVGWVFLFGAVYCLPRKDDNPFKEPPQGDPVVGEGGQVETHDDSPKRQSNE